MKSGIYMITNTVNNKFYVGSAVHFKKREYVHLCRLRGDKHPNKHLQAAFNLYGEDKFAFQVLECCEQGVLIEREQHWIDWTQAVELGYNILKVAGSSIGYKHTEEFKKNRSKLYKGKKQSPELIEKRIAPLRGMRHTEETKIKYSLCKIGNKHRLGIPQSEETKKKIGDKNRNKIMSEEQKLKISLTKQLKRDIDKLPLSLENEIKWQKPQD